MVKIEVSFCKMLCTVLIFVDIRATCRADAPVYWVFLQVPESFVFLVTWD